MAVPNKHKVKRSSPKRGFVFFACGERHAQRANIALSFLKRVTRKEIVVLRARSTIPIQCDQTIDCFPPADLSDRQASVVLKTNIHRILGRSHHTWCYLDTDVIAVSQNADRIFDHHRAEVSFARDHCDIDSLSKHAVHCGCHTEHCQHLRDQIKKSFDVHIPDGQWVPWNGGVFVFGPDSGEILDCWHSYSATVLSDPTTWHARDQGALAAVAWKYGLQSLRPLPRRFNRIVDGMNGIPIEMRGRSSQLTVDHTCQLGTHRNAPVFLHFINDTVGRKGWKNWDDVEALSSEPSVSVTVDESLRAVAPRPEVRLFWTGPPLSPYEELSLRSFVAAGARVLLYATSKDLAVPEGVELVDAREILSGQVHHFTFADGVRSPALHSDLFRYLAIQQFGGWYADLDIVLVAKEMPRSKVYIARESDELVNGAVMKFPAGSPFLSAAIDEAWKLLPEAGPGAPLSKRISIGPRLVTQLARDYALDHLIRPQSSAYEIASAEIPLMFDPGHREELDERIANSDFVHLWNEVWRWARIPKNFGPPAGSFLDGLFRRVGMTFADDARLSAESIAVWFRERNILEELRWRLGMEVTPPNALALLMKRSGADQPTAVLPRPGQRGEGRRARPVRTAAAPQTVRTFWHGGPIGPYQLLCLRSFVDRGHRVEVFSFEPIPELPDWLVRENAEDIVSSSRVLRYLPEQRRVAVHAHLFRHALLHRLGGWWIDPDIVLLRTELPTGELFFGGPTEFGVIPSGAIRFPAGHPVLTDALIQGATFDDSVANWEQAGASALTQSIASNKLLGACKPVELVSPLSWFDVLRVFDPGDADLLAKELDGRLFLDLHMDVWLRAGVPNFLGPPRGCFLDRLFERHDFPLIFATHMEFGDVRRWITHMYECTYPGRASNA